MKTIRTSLVLRGFGDDIEMPDDFAGKGADPNMVSQPVPTVSVTAGAFQNLVGSLVGLISPSSVKPTMPVRPMPKKSMLPTLAIVGLAIGGIILLKKKANQ